MAVLAVTGSVLLVATTPAQADPPELTVTISATEITSGQTAQLKYTVTGEDDDTSVKVDVAVFDAVSCGQDCSVTATGTGSFTAVLTGNTLAAGQTRSGTIKVTATSKGLLGNEEVESKSVNLTVRGPAAVQTVKKISGTVVDSKTNAGISGASVAIQDGGGHRYNTETNARGTFTFNGSTENPITPGSINMIVVAKDFENGALTVNGSNGQTVSEVSFKLASTAKASPSATPSATPSAEPSETPSPEASATGGEATPAATDDLDSSNASNETEDDSGIPWFVILIGALLVAIGVGTIVLLFIRRKQDKEADAAAVSDYQNRPAGTPGAYGATNDATRIGGAGMAAGGMDDATRITTPLSDAPTMITSRAAMDEFPDPYGAPPPGAPGAPKWAGEDGYAGPADATRVGYGDDRGGYGTAGSASVSGGGGYGDSADNYGAGAGGYDRGGYGTAGAASVSGSGYGSGGRGDYGGQGGAAAGSVSGGGGYGAGNDPYEEPTGRYNGGADGYGGQGGGYGAAPAGPYGQRADQGGYGAQEIDYGTQKQGGDRAGYGGGQGGYGGGGQGGAGAQGGYGSGQADEYGSGGGYGGGQGGYGGQGGAGAQGGGYGGGAGGGQGGYGDRGGYDQDGYDQQGGGGYGAGQSGYPPAQPGADRAGYDQQGNGYEQGGNRGDNRGTGQRGDRRIDWMDD